MRPLWLVALGVAAMAVDFRIRGVDLVPDVVGGVLIVVVVHRLLPRPWTVLAAVGAVASVSSLALPYHHRILEVPGVDPVTGEAVVVRTELLEIDPVSGVRLAALALTVVIAVAVLARLLATLRRRAAGHGATAELRVPVALGAAAAALWAVPELVAMAVGWATGDGFDVVWNGDAWALAFIGTAVAVAFAGSLLPIAREPWALPPGQQLRTGRWAGVSPRDGGERAGRRSPRPR